MATSGRALHNYIADNPKIAMMEIESILDLMSFGDEDSLRRMMRHARAYMKPHNFDKRIRDKKETYANKRFEFDQTFHGHRNEIMKAIYHYVEHIFDEHWDKESLDSE